MKSNKRIRMYSNKIDNMYGVKVSCNTESALKMISVSNMASNALYLFALSAYSKYTTGILLLNTFTLSSVYVKYYGKGIKKKKTRCYGGVLRVKNKNSGEYEYAVVQGRKTRKWSFPKGHADEGEEHLETALREIEEETGITSLGEPIQYLKSASDHYYVFDLEKKLELKPIDTTEVISTKWVTIKELEMMDVNVGISMYIKRVKRSEK